MSILKNILSPFVEFPDDKKPVSPAETKIEKATAPPVETKFTTGNEQAPVDSQDAIAVPPLTTNSSAGAALTTALPEHKSYFEKLIEDANEKNPLFQGTDFKEFIDSKSDIDAISDEATRYRTAFNVLKRTGLTKERLLSTGQEYLNLIGRALNSYQGAYVQQYQKDVRGKEQLLQKKAEEIQALNEKIATLKTDIKQLSDEITTSKARLDAGKASFLSAGETKQTEIQTELQKINQYF